MGGEAGEVGVVAGTATDTVTGDRLPPGGVSRRSTASPSREATALAMRAASAALRAVTVMSTTTVSTGFSAVTMERSAGTDSRSPRSLMTGWSTSGLCASRG